jgi:hypothetical protein
LNKHHTQDQEVAKALADCLPNPKKAKTGGGDDTASVATRQKPTLENKMSLEAAIVMCNIVAKCEDTKCIVHHHQFDCT